MVYLLQSVSKLQSYTRALQRTPARHKEISIIASADDEAWRPTPRLLDVALAAASRARSLEFPELDGRQSSEPRWYRVWPGEHYRLLAALVRELGASRVVEIGTSTGMGTLAIAAALPPGGSVATFDLIPWDKFEKTWFTEGDFASGSIAQHIANIGAPGSIEPYRELFADADFIFIDGPKDGVTERHFIGAVSSLELPKNPIVMFDDIRVLNMIEIWRRLARPKMDLTSFGHWSGTGLVDWNGALGA
ncbi:MAG: O-methyltransferase [Rhodomicrobium sp.]